MAAADGADGAPCAPPPGRCWVQQGTSAALCQLVMEDRSREGPRQRARLPPSLWAEQIAPFLRFDAPLPGMLYAFGGRNRRQGPIDSVEMLDAWHGIWVPCPTMPCRRAGSAAAVLPDGRLLVCGGYDARGIVEGLLASCDIYDPYAEKWAEGGAAPLARARWGHGCAALGGKVYCVGGCALREPRGSQDFFMETLRSCEVFLPEEGRWEPCCPLQVPRSGSRVVSLGRDHLAAVGGCDDVFGRAETQATVEIFSEASGQWSLLDLRLTVPRTSAAVAAIDGGCLLIAGGAPSQSSVEVCHALAPLGPPSGPPSGGPRKEGKEQEGDAEAKLSDMPEARMGCQAAVVSLPLGKGGGPGGMASRPCVVVVGGERCDQASADPGGVPNPMPRVQQLHSCVAYDLSTGGWLDEDSVPLMCESRTTMALCCGLGRVAPARVFRMIDP